MPFCDIKSKPMSFRYPVGSPVPVDQPADFPAALLKDGHLPDFAQVQMTLAATDAPMKNVAIEPERAGAAKWAGAKHMSEPAEFLGVHMHSGSIIAGLSRFSAISFGQHGNGACRNSEGGGW